MKALLTVLFVILLSADVLAHRPGGPPPSIIVFLADDYGVVGQEHHITPNIDALAATGIRYTRAHAMPNCTPSRGALHTGLYPFSNGLVGNTGACLDPALPTMGKSLQALGYETAMAGKYGLCGNLSKQRIHPKEVGFDRYAVKTSGKLSAYYFDPPVLYDTGEIEQIPGSWGPGIYERWSIEFLRTCQEPCFLLHNFNLVHVPIVNPWHRTLRTDGVSEPPPIGTRLYDDMVRYMDEIIGRVVAAAPIDSIIIFLGDNGTSWYFGGDKGPWTNLKQAATHIPLIINGVGRHSDDRRLVSITDIYPTVIELAGGLPPLGLDGVSVFGPERRHVAAHSFDKGSMIQNDLGWKLKRTLAGPGTVNSPWRLYFLPGDAQEEHPIPHEGTPAADYGIAKQMQAEMEAYWADIGGE